MTPAGSQGDVETTTPSMASPLLFQRGRGEGRGERRGERGEGGEWGGGRGESESEVKKRNGWLDIVSLTRIPSRPGMMEFLCVPPSSISLPNCLY